MSQCHYRCRRQGKEVRMASHLTVISTLKRKGAARVSLPPPHSWMLLGRPAWRSLPPPPTQCPRYLPCWRQPKQLVGSHHPLQLPLQQPPRPRQRTQREQAKHREEQQQQQQQGEKQDQA